MTDRVGQQLGNYRLVRLLGQGGFADVYLGEHIYLKTSAAIKVLQMRLTNEDMEGFLNEARTIAGLKHAHIVRVLDFGIDDSTPFLVMDYAPMGTLRERHAKGSRLPTATILSYVKQVAAALQYAHDKKLIHRDIKPENMLLESDNDILLSDFGIATAAQSSRYQSTQEAVGTLAYMSPEQLQGKPRIASDQYSLGIVVYEWLTGDRPFHGSFIEMASQHMLVPPPPLREKVSELPTELEEVVLTALAKDPQQRFKTIQAFATAFEQAYKSEPHHPAASTSEPLLPTVIFNSPNHPLPPTVVAPAPSPPLPPTIKVPQPKVTSPVGTTLFIYRGHSHNVEAVAWSPDSRYLSSGDGNGTVQVWNASKGDRVFTNRGHSKWISAVVWSPDGKCIATGSHDQTVQIWDATNGQQIFTYRGHTAPVSAIAWSPDGKWIASGSWDGTVQLWDAVSGGYILTCRHSAPVHSVAVNAIGWSPDSKRIASASSDKTVQLWDVFTRKHIFTYRDHSDIVLATAWSLDGKSIASAGYDQSVQVWDAANGSRNFIHQGHSRIVRALSWSPDGRSIASASRDTTVHMWNTTTKVRIFTYSGHFGAVTDVAWSPDGTRIASGSEDKTVQVWQA